MASRDEAECPLCAEELDATDAAVIYCKCHYSMCLWCWHRICEDATKEGVSARCPNCRTEYDIERIRQQRVDPALISETKKKGKKDEKKRATGAPKSRKDLANVRVVQRNLVYVVGLAMDICYEDVLKGPDYFGQFGKVYKISVSRAGPYGSSAAKNGPTGSAYVTFRRNEDARRCIEVVHNTMWEGKPVKACFGTTKYCNAFLKGIACNNTDCLYLHEVADEDDSYTKEETKSTKFVNLVHAVSLTKQTSVGLAKQPSCGTLAVGSPAPAPAPLAGPGPPRPPPALATSRASSERLESAPESQGSAAANGGTWPALGSTTSWAAKALASAAQPAPPPLPPSAGGPVSQEWPELSGAASSPAGDGIAAREDAAPTWPPLGPGGAALQRSGSTMAAQLARAAAPAAVGLPRAPSANGLVTAGSASKKKLTQLAPPGKRAGGSSVRAASPPERQKDGDAAVEAGKGTDAEANGAAMPGQAPSEAQGLSASSTARQKQQKPAAAKVQADAPVAPAPQPAPPAAIPAMADPSSPAPRSSSPALKASPAACEPSKAPASCVGSTAAMADRPAHDKEAPIGGEASTLRSDDPVVELPRPGSASKLGAVKAAGPLPGAAAPPPTANGVLRMKKVGPPPGFGGPAVDRAGNATHGGLAMLPSPFQSVSDFQSFGSESSAASAAAPEPGTSAIAAGAAPTTAAPKDASFAPLLPNGFAAAPAGQVANLWAAPKEAAYLNGLGGLGSIWGAAAAGVAANTETSSGAELAAQQQQQRAVSRFDFAREAQATPPPVGRAPLLLAPAQLQSPFALASHAGSPGGLPRPHVPLPSDTPHPNAGSWPGPPPPPPHGAPPPPRAEWAPRGYVPPGRAASTGALAAQLPDQAALQQHMGEAFLAPYAAVASAAPPPPQAPSGLALLRQLQLGGLRAGEAPGPQQGYGLGAVGGLPALSLPPGGGFLDPAIMAAQRAASLQGGLSLALAQQQAQRAGLGFAPWVGGAGTLTGDYLARNPAPLAPHPAFLQGHGLLGGLPGLGMPSSPGGLPLVPLPGMGQQAVHGLGHLGGGPANGGMTEAVRREMALREATWMDNESLRNISAM